MEQLVLAEVQSGYAEEIWRFREEILAYDAGNEDRFAGCFLLNTSDSAEEWIRICQLRKSKEGCEALGIPVPSHTFLAIRKSDGRLVGIIDLRHSIDHPILGTLGGHTGYSVRPSERGKGYAKEMLRLNLRNAAAMGIESLLVTCGVENKASEAVILENGGVIESVIEADGAYLKRYWIKTMQQQCAAEDMQ